LNLTGSAIVEYTWEENAKKKEEDFVSQEVGENKKTQEEAREEEALALATQIGIIGPLSFWR